MEIISKLLAGFFSLTASCCSISVPLVTFNSSDGLSFDQLWSAIEKSYTSVPEHIQQSQKLSLGKNNLKSILEQGNNSMSDGIIDSSKGKNCKGTGTEMEIFCGYLVLRNNNIMYKLKIASGNDNKGRIKIVKNIGAETTYWNHSQGNGITKTGVDFQFKKLSDYDNDNSTNEGEKFSEDSILQPIGST